MLGKDTATNGASRRVATTSTTMDGDDFAFVALDGGENLFEGVGSVSIIYDDGEGLAFVDKVHATFDRGEGGDTLLDLRFSKSKVLTHDGGGKGIVDVELARDFGFDFHVVEGVFDAGNFGLDMLGTIGAMLDAVGSIIISQGFVIFGGGIVSVENAIFGLTK